MKQLVFLICLLCFPITAQASGKTQEVVSRKGITAWLFEDHAQPVISMRFSFAGGVEHDPKEKQGLASLTALLLTQGAGPYNARAFQDRLAASSISLSFQAGRDVLGGSLYALSKHKDKAFEMLRLALLKPHFPEDELNRLRNQAKIGVRFQVTDPSWQARFALYSYIYQNHPYSYRSQGTAETLQNITRADVVGFAHKHFTKKNLLVSVAGAITKKELIRALDEAFGSLPDRATRKEIPPVHWPQDAATLCVPRKGAQTSLLFAAPMVNRQSPDWYIAVLANYILGGGGFESRLMKAVRAEKGFTYGVSTNLASMEKDSLILAQADISNKAIGKTVALIRKVWSEFSDEGITQGELQTAKDYIIGSWPLRLSSTNAVAGTYLGIRENKLGLDYAEQYKDLFGRVTRDQANRFIKNNFDPRNLSYAAIGSIDQLSCDQTKELAGE